ncbi:NADPH-dependent glutamate synthase beta chain/oxidoreductase-related protein [Gaiella occulta]|uniref:ferredoxin--NADP(+) reductase n=1 Tax=Gaiella occulta TaxID=1002870 RepID=A0A7M2YXI2_9ACTN|nr:FAD-dependent oxidoreductase [Gaiella occulta]RDI74187.1 NADPH-dependent glutamate synthase beta chain/oxidoreductase-related protein [Gaiella occulta]
MSPERPLRVAVVGSGPAGFYAAGQLLAADPPVEVDMFDRLPTPWGLVRLGVAPDHPNIKAVSRVFERIAQRPGFRFFGNVEIGRDLDHDDLASAYDAVLYAVGAQADRRMGIPGEDLPGSWPATAFVAWYNGHPDYHGIPFDLSARRAVVVGNGNVAVDVARMLALTPEELASTDTADDAIAAIVEGGIEEIVVLGRRGPAQAAFTTPELIELTELAGADLIVDPADLELDPASAAALEDDTAIARRNVEVLREAAARPPQGRPKAVRLRFCVSPVAILGDGRVEAVEVVHNELVSDDRGRITAVPGGTREVIECGLVLRSVGYRGVPLPGVPFDERTCTIPNRGGRVVGADGAVLPGLYCAGWIKRGPSGVIGTNKKDAAETVELLLEDARAGTLPRASGGDVAELLAARGVAAVSHAGWQAIDARERALGEEQGRPRVKLCRWDELLGAARAVESGGRALLP